MKILCLDQATNKTGWALFDNKKLLEYGDNDFSHIKDFDNKISAVLTWIKELIKKTEAEIVAIEDVQYQGIVRSYRPLVELIGVLRNYFYEQEYLYLVISNKTWKQTCGVKGRKREEQKQNAMLFVKNKYNLGVPSDVADAICLGHHVTHKELKRISGCK